MITIKELTELFVNKGEKMEEEKKAVELVLDVANGLEERAKQLRNIINFLSRSEFVLTGSRRFGYDTSSSDFDYFIKESDAEKLTDEFAALGFVATWANRDYHDLSMVCLLENGTMFDVQVIRDNWFDKKKQANDIFKREYCTDSEGEPKRPFGSKRFLRVVWDRIMNDIGPDDIVKKINKGEKNG